MAFTGTLGESKRDLDALFRGEKISDNSRFLEPVLRAEFIAKSRAFLRVGMDISDGLYCDTNKLLNINKYGFEILKTINDSKGLSGEEYEMLVGFDPQNIEPLKEIAKELDIPLTIYAKVAKNNERFSCKSHHF